MFIPYIGPFKISDTLHGGQAFRWDPPYHGSEWHTGVISGNVVKIKQRATGLEFRCSPNSQSQMRPVIEDYLRLHDDLNGIFLTFPDDKHMSLAIAKYNGLRILRQDPWECLISFICSANNNIARITGLVARLCETFGSPIDAGNCQYRSFPSPDVLSDVGEQRLRDIGLGFRAPYVYQTAREISRNESLLTALREASYKDALNQLVELPGVGDKIANCVLLFSMEKLEAFPVDIWIKRVLRERYLSDSSPNRVPDTALRPWAQSYFGPYAGYANQYLFHSTRLKPR